MFLDELTPIFKELTQQPVAFLGGLCSGIFRLKPTEDPLKSWLTKQGIPDFSDLNGNDSNSGPQSIDIE